MQNNKQNNKKLISVKNLNFNYGKDAILSDISLDIYKGKNVVIVAHKLNTIKQAHQIILIDKGQIIAKGKHDELIKEPLYASLWKQYLGEE